MAKYRHHSGYLADDEGGHSTYMAPMPRKHLLPEMGPTYNLGRVPYLPSLSRCSEHQGHQQPLRPPQAFGSFLDFLTEGQVLDSLQTVVEQATERVAAMKTEAGVPLIDVQDPVEVPSGRHRARARLRANTVGRHRAQPTLCAGQPNNYPSCSSSVSDFHSGVKAGGLDSHSQDSDPGARGIGSLPPMRDKLLLEKNLKRLLQLESKGVRGLVLWLRLAEGRAGARPGWTLLSLPLSLQKGLYQSNSQRDSLLWDSLGSQTSSQWTQEPPLSWFSGLLGSCSATPETSELRLGEQEMMFLKQELSKEMKSLLSQPASFNLPTYCSLREPHRTLDFLAEHHLFPALQRVVSQAVDKLSHACRHDGFPLFPVASEPTPGLPVTSDLLQPSSKASEPTDREDREDREDSPTTVSSPKTARKKSKSRRGSPSTSNAQMSTRFRLKSPNTKFTKKKPLPSISSVSSLSYISNPWFEELTNFLVEQAVSLLVCKYKFEESLRKQLGFISFPITEVLMDIILGFKKVKGTHIRLSSDINWTCLLRKLEEAELARQAIRRASRPGASHHSASHHSASHHSASHHSASHHSTDSHSAQPKFTGDTSQDQTTEPRFSLRPELPIRQLLSPRGDPGIGQEQMTNRSLSEDRPTLLLSGGMGSRPSQSKEAVNTEEGADEEEEEEEEDGGSEEEEVKDSSEGGHTSTLPEPELDLTIRSLSDSL
ncbi:coiled-coil domain-containing protein 116 [Acomys russatus]|uniref:coiled-coil domain-containing protein 116 n=1 Tax=Acomys russatus TaxID=60746 RepID=UPI0021E32F5F|nr:coiled-coil domain-containing protein 116 [Acomys russatus]